VWGGRWNDIIPGVKPRAEMLYPFRVLLDEGESSHPKGVKHISPGQRPGDKKFANHFPPPPPPRDARGEGECVLGEREVSSCQSSFHRHRVGGDESVDSAQLFVMV